MIEPWDLVKRTILQIYNPFETKVIKGGGLRKKKKKKKSNKADVKNTSFNLA